MIDYVPSVFWARDDITMADTAGFGPSFTMHSGSVGRVTSGHLNLRSLGSGAGKTGDWAEWRFHPNTDDVQHPVHARRTRPSNTSTSPPPDRPLGGRGGTIRGDPHTARPVHRVIARCPRCGRVEVHKMRSPKPAPRPEVIAEWERTHTTNEIREWGNPNQSGTTRPGPSTNRCSR
ncbi:hypothetical protein ACTD5D_00295 [Nocardia takedensis]|uniref:hypothetical protein n=1 Tax=Nocardia takedensis TaxID=259390 RepID=UPI003F770930